MHCRGKLPQALRVLAVRAVRCRCGVALRALPPLEAETRAGPVRVVDGDDLVAALVTTERQKLADEGPCVRLNRHQVLRVLLVRAARCACSIEGRVGVAR